MKILVACEFSGIVRDAFIKEGHDAISCDFLPSESDFGPHIQGDVTPYLEKPWDLVIAHPPCTYLCNSGVRWLFDEQRNKNKPRWHSMYKACDFFLKCLNANAPYVAVENPIMHGYARRHMNLRKHNHSCQPYEFGIPETKRICWWTKGWLPILQPTNLLYRYKNKIHELGPSKNRAKERSRFYPGIAKAMAKQWSRYIDDKINKQ